MMSVNTNSINYVKGDATRPVGQGIHDCLIIVPHVVNDIGVWGAGFANAITKRWGQGVRQSYLSWFRDKIDDDKDDLQTSYGVVCDSLEESGRFCMGAMQLVHVEKSKNVTFANMVAQHETIGQRKAGSRPPIRYAALANAMGILATQIKLINHNIEEEHKKCRIACPRFGSGLAGGDWKTIESLINEVWIDNGIKVSVYDDE